MKMWQWMKISLPAAAWERHLTSDLPLSATSLDDEVVADVRTHIDLLIEFVKTYQHIFIVNNHTSIKTSGNAVLE